MLETMFPCTDAVFQLDTEERTLSHEFHSYNGQVCVHSCNCLTSNNMCTTRSEPNKHGVHVSMCALKTLCTCCRQSVWSLF